MEAIVAEATTAKFEELKLEVETAVAGTFAIIAGMTDVTITRTANVDTTETPDATDESLPFYIDKNVRSIDVKVSGTGVWAQESNALLNNWFYSGARKNVRITMVKAAPGDPSIEAGPALLATLTNARSKGKQNTAEISLEIIGTPAVTNAAAGA